MRLLHERTDTSGRCLDKPLCSYMAHTWLTHWLFGAHAATDVDRHTAAEVYAASAEACIVLACAARRSLRRHLTNGCHGSYEHIFVYVVISNNTRYSSPDSGTCSSHCCPASTSVKVCTSSTVSAPSWTQCSCDCSTGRHSCADRTRQHHNTGIFRFS